MRRALEAEVAVPIQHVRTFLSLICILVQLVSRRTRCWTF